MEVYTGIDWSENKHDVIFMNESGVVIFYFVIPHTPDGFRKFDDTRKKLGVTPADCLVGLETAHNLIIDFLWSRNYSQVYVIPPNVVKSCQGRYRQSRPSAHGPAAFAALASRSALDPADARQDQSSFLPDSLNGSDLPRHPAPEHGANQESHLQRTGETIRPASRSRHLCLAARSGQALGTSSAGQVRGRP